MSFEGELAPSFDLRCLSQGEVPPDGWGIGYYPGGEPAAAVLKEPAPAQRLDPLRAHQGLGAPRVLHLPAPRPARHLGRHLRRQHPALPAGLGAARLALRPRRVAARTGSSCGPGAPFEPVGATDTELIFCELMNRFAERGWKSLGEADPARAARVAGRASTSSGNLTCVLTDGHDVAVYADRESAGIWLWEVLPPYDRLTFGDAELLVDLGKRGREEPQGRGGELPSAAGERRGAGVAAPSRPATWCCSARARCATCSAPWVIPRRPPGAARHASAGRCRARPGPSPAATGVVHRTSYRYDKPVERSSPRLQALPGLTTGCSGCISHDLAVSVDGQYRDYEDVFGNQARRMEVETPVHRDDHHRHLAGRGARHRPALLPAAAPAGADPGGVDALAPAGAAALPAAARAGRDRAEGAQRVRHELRGAQRLRPRSTRCST